MTHGSTREATWVCIQRLGCGEGEIVVGAHARGNSLTGSPLACETTNNYGSAFVFEYNANTSSWEPTDTIDNVDKTRNVKNIEVLPISALMGEAIKRISNSTSVSDLFK